MRGHLIHPGTGHFNANAETRRHATHILEGVGPVVSAGVRQDTSRNSLAGQDTANMPGLRRNTSFKRRDYLVGGTFLGAGQIRRHGTRGTGNLGNLEDCDVCVGARHVTAGDVEKGIEHRSAQPGGVIRHRVAQAQGLATRIVGGNALTIPGVGHKRVGLDLDQSAIGQRSSGQTTSLLRGRQAVACRCGRHDHGNVVVAVKARDFLDQIRREREIGTPRGSRHRERAVVGAFNDATDRAQQLGDALGSVGNARQALHLADGQRNDDGLAALIHVGDAGIDGASAIFEEKLDRTLGSNRGKLRVRAALETLRGLRVQLVSARAAGDGHRIEVCSLEQHVSRAFANLGVGTTHDTGDADNARTLSLGRVGDQQILRVELALFLVQGHQRLARAGTAHDDRGGQVAQVVGVHRLTEVKHDVVSNVDGQRQRSHARGLETLDHPARSRSVGVRAAHDASNETVHTNAATDRRVVGEHDRETVGVRSRRLSRDHAGQAGVAERGARRV